MVPDVAAFADASPGYPIVCSQGVQGCNGFIEELTRRRLGVEDLNDGAQTVVEGAEVLLRVVYLAEIAVDGLLEAIFRGREDGGEEQCRKDDAGV